MKSTQITRLGMTCAIVFLGFAIDTLLRNLFAFQIAVVSLIAVITIALVSNRREAIVAGVALGVFSMIRAIVFGGGIAGAILVASFWTSFANPIVAVLPRTFIGLVVFYARIGLAKLIKSHTVVNAISSALGVITNTGLVCVVLFVMNLIATPNFDVWGFIYTYFTINCIIELVICAIAIPAIVGGLKKTPYFREDTK